MQHIPNPSSHPSPTPMDEILEWLKNTMAKIRSSITQEDIAIHIPSLESNLCLCYPPSSTSHDSLYHDSLDQYASQDSYTHCLDFEAAGFSSCHVQSNLIIQEGEEEGEDTIDSSSIFQNGSH